MLIPFGKMTPQRWQQVNELFAAVVELEPEQRATVLDQTCADDPLLRSEVESLLLSDGSGWKLIERPALEMAAALLANEQWQLTPGQSFSHYEIVSLIGKGGMGEVYLAKDNFLNRRIALKLLPGDYTSDSEHLRRFQQEAQAASALNHPNILTIHEIGQAEEQPFIATEFVDGQTLRQRLKRALTLSETLEIAIQVGNALSAAHQAGIVHRDIKPENIMLRRDAYVKVLDFGLAKLTEHRESRTRPHAADDVDVSTGLVMGTVKYMSPEQAHGEQVDARSDIFSFGVVLYEMIAGCTPFEGETANEMIAAITGREPPPLTDAPQEVQTVVAKALRKRKEERYQTIENLLMDLKRLKEDKTVTSMGAETIARKLDGSGLATSEAVAIFTASTVERLANGSRQVRSIMFGSAAIVVVIAAVILFFWSRNFWPANSLSKNEKSINSVAILPFANGSSDPNVQYLSDGIADYLTNALSRLPALTVISNNAAARYRSRDQTGGQDVLDAAHALNVEAVLTGRMAQQGSRIQVSIELIDVRNNRHLWNKRYERDATDILSVQEEIAKELSETLRSRLTGNEKDQLSKRYTQSNEAYQAYLRGRYAWNKRTEPDLQKAINFFNEAIGIDPQFSLAYAGLADSYQVLIFHGGLPPSAYSPMAKAAAERAIEIDDSLAEAHTALAYVKFYYEWDWPGAEREFKRAIELNPNYATTHQWYGEYLGNMGRQDESFAERQKALRLDPLSPIITSELGFSYLYARKYDQAIEEFRKAAELYPDFSPAHDFLAYAYQQVGRYDEAIAETQKSIALAHDSHDFIGLARINARSGRRGEAQRLLRDIAEGSKDRYYSSALMATVYVALGDKDRAFEWLEKAYQQRDWGLVQLRVSPDFDSIRNDPRFVDLLNRMSFSQ